MTANLLANLTSICRILVVTLMSKFRIPETMVQSEHSMVTSKQSMEKSSQKQGMWQDEKPQNGALLITFVVSIFPPPPWSFWGKLTLLAANTRNHQTPKIHFPYFSPPGKPATPIGMAARVIEPEPYTVQAGALLSPTPWAGRSYGRRI